MSGCMCEFDNECNGLGTLQCRGCGGDACICICGGETECDGCQWCWMEREDILQEVEDAWCGAETERDKP
jgi:hypothetical protein